MSTQGAPATGRLSRAVGWARQAPAKRVGGPVGAVALAVSGAFGGLAPVQAAYDDAGGGATIETGPLEVSVDRLRAIDDIAPYAAPEEGNRLLVVVLDVRNTTDEPVFGTLLSSELEVETTGAEVDPDVRPRLVSMRDFSAISEFQPDLDYEVGMLLETVGQDVVTRAEVGIPGYTWRADSFTPGLSEWKDATIVARGTYAVKDVPDEPAAGGGG